MADPTFDFAKPYDIMCGVWAGMATVYNPKGEYQFAAPSRVAIYWRSRTRLHYRQDELDDLDAFLDQQPAVQSIMQPIRQVLHISFDLKIQGKAGGGSSGAMDVTATESMPGVYLFRLAAKDGAGVYYNSQYFMDANRRNIVGPFVGRDGLTSLVIAQSFSRVSYDVPDRFKSDLATAPHVPK